MKPTSKLGYITNLKKKDSETCDTEWRSIRGNKEGLNFPLHLAKNSLGSIIGPFWNYLGIIERFGLVTVEDK
jgi:hypothetical protein